MKSTDEVNTNAKGREALLKRQAAAQAVAKKENRPHAKPVNSNPGPARPVKP